MSNSSGSYRSTDQAAMRAYDKLPPAARKALADAAFNWAPQPIVTKWNRGYVGYKTGPDIARKVVEWDADRIAKDRSRVWGVKGDAAKIKGKR
jgi:hypothetical protein